jgi:hypothetical protein
MCMRHPYGLGHAAGLGGSCGLGVHDAATWCRRGSLVIQAEEDAHVPQRCWPRSFRLAKELRPPIYLGIYPDRLSPSTLPTAFV